MQPYQKEYIANLNEISALAAQRKAGKQDFEGYLEKQLQARTRLLQTTARNMELLQTELFPLLDHLYDVKPEELAELEEFAGVLFDGRQELDVGLFCQIRRALLNSARMRRNRNDMIRHLYWLGMGYNKICSMLVGLDWQNIEGYMSQMRLCFMEAAAYLKYFEEIDDTDTKGYILRSRANVSLGQFKSPDEKISLVKYTLQILQDKGYQEKAPDLPWSRFLYMTHQQMAASISRSKDKVMSPQNIADVMESVYIVYEKQLEEARSRKEQPPARISFSYDSINYYCGLITLDELLRKTELLMDAADETDFSPENMYRVISLPAFYCNFLQDHPAKIPERTEYMDSLYRRAVNYVEIFPKASENETLFFYLSQLMSTFIEIENSVSYGDFLRKLLMRFAPEIYVHSYVVGRAAAALCTVIMEEEPTYFDDMEAIREIADPQKKRDEVLDYAMESGIFHDVGKINFINLYSRISRQWFAKEYELTQLHTLAGAKRLAERPSTQRYSAIALGHHSWYNGSQGYPDSYRRLECPFRQMTDIIGLMDWLDNVTDFTYVYTGVQMNFEEAIQTAVSQEGKMFSPLLTARIRDKMVVEKILQAFQDGRRDAYQLLYDAEL